MEVTNHSTHIDRYIHRGRLDRERIWWWFALFDRPIRCSLGATR